MDLIYLLIGGPSFIFGAVSGAVCMSVYYQTKEKKKGNK